MPERVIEQKVEFSASQQQVWQAITDPEKIAKWFGQDEAEKIVKMSDDKWDDAVAVEMTANECPTAAEQDGDRWFFFFGWASS